MLVQCGMYADEFVHVRDHARPVTEADVWFLRETRHFGAPTGKKRVDEIARKEAAPKVTPAHAARIDAQMRLRANLRAQRARQILVAGNMLPRVCIAEPLPSRGVNLSHDPLGKLTDEDRAERFRQLIAESVRLIHIGRALPYGKDRKEVFRRVTALLKLTNR